MTKTSDKVKRWRARTLKDINYIMGNSCSICGYNKTQWSLHYHHINQSQKEFGISQLRSSPGSWHNIENELRKCTLVCANCHGEIHARIIEAPTTSSFSEDRLKEIYKPCKNNCGKLVRNKNREFCCKVCRLSFLNKEKEINKQLINNESTLCSLDVITLLSKHNGIMYKAAAEIGLSDNGLKKRFKKITGCNNWKEYLLTV